MIKGFNIFGNYKKVGWKKRGSGGLGLQVIEEMVALDGERFEVRSSRMQRKVPNRLVQDKSVPDPPGLGIFDPPTPS